MYKLLLEPRLECNTMHTLVKPVQETGHIKSALFHTSRAEVLLLSLWSL